MASIIGLVFVSIIGMALLTGLALAFYAALPQSMWNRAQHGRYAGLAAGERRNDTIGNAPVAGIGALQGQSL